MSEARQYRETLSMMVLADDVSEAARNEVEALRLENRVLKALLGEQAGVPKGVEPKEEKAAEIYRFMRKRKRYDGSNAAEMLSKFNGHPVALTSFYTKTKQSFDVSWFVRRGHYITGLLYNGNLSSAHVRILMSSYVMGPISILISPRRVNIPMPDTNAWKQLSWKPQASTNTSPRRWPHSLELIKWK